MIDKLDALKEKIDRINKEKKERDETARLAAEKEAERVRAEISKGFFVLLNDVKNLSQYTEGVYSQLVLPLPERFSIRNLESGELFPICLKYSCLHLEGSPVFVDGVSVLMLNGNKPIMDSYETRNYSSVRLSYDLYVTDKGTLFLDNHVKGSESQLSTVDFLRIYEQRDNIKETMKELIINWESKYRDETIKFLEQKLEEYISDYERE